MLACCSLGAGFPPSTRPKQALQVLNPGSHMRPVVTSESRLPQEQALKILAGSPQAPKPEPLLGGSEARTKVGAKGKGHTCDPAPQEAKAGGWRVQGQPGNCKTW